jgi:hypothetical protein
MLWTSKRNFQIRFVTVSEVALFKFPKFRNSTEMLSFNRLAQGTVALIGGVGVLAMMAGAARAEGASVTGAVTYTTPGSYSLSISAQKVAPAGYKFDGDVQVTVQGVSGSAPIGLTVSAGTLTALPTAATAAAPTLKTAVIAKLGTITGNAAADLDAYASILKAAAGADGLE